MSLNSDQLDAFFEVAKCASFSRAADDLGISQPALSQRIKKLEESLNSALFLRESNGAVLTELGQRLLLYCRNRRDLEAEFLSARGSQELTGVVRVAGFSSIMRSVVMPALSDLVKSQPHLQIELVTRELHQLPGVLKTAQSDFVLTDRAISSGSIESVFLGTEENVLVESSRHGGRVPDIYFDHDSDDQVTFEFFKKQGRKKPATVRRSFLDEVYGIIDAVERGWGRAVLQRHLISEHRGLRIVEQYSPMKTDVFLNYHAQPFYLPLHQSVSKALKENVPTLLKGD